MARLIDADAFEKFLMNLPDEVLCEDCCYVVVNEMRNQPTIEPKQEWISVKDRLPEQYAVVIVYDGEQVGEAEFNGVDFGWVESEDLAFVTHWMPFPEPPERMDGE